MQNNKFILIYVMPISAIEVARTEFGSIIAKHGHMEFMLPIQIDWKLITYFPNV